MKDIGAHVGYTFLWDRVSKVVGAGVQMCYYPAALSNHVMAVLSGTRVVRVLCVYGCVCVCVCVCVFVCVCVCVWPPPVVWRHACASGLRPSVLGCVLLALQCF